MPFEFHAAHRLTRLTGRMAGTLDELLEHLREAPAAAIFEHTYGRCLRHAPRPLAFNSDFAEWVSRAVRNPDAASGLRQVNLWDWVTLDEVRGALVAAVDSSAGKPRECPPGDEFHFCASEAFVLPTGAVATDLEGFASEIEGCSDSSIFHHFVEARLRLGTPSNDFSAWLDSLGEQSLAEQIEEIDRDVLTITEIRDKIRQLCLRRLSE